MPKKTITLEDLAVMVSRGFESVHEQSADFRTSVTERFDRVEHRLDGLEQRLGGVERRLDAFADEIGTHRHRIKQLERKTGITN